MALPVSKLPFVISLTLLMLISPSNAFTPYGYSTRGPVWDLLDDPFRVLEQTPLSLPRNPDPSHPALLARADWKETPNCHVITVDVPGVKREDVKVEVEVDTRVLKVSGERKADVVEEGEGDKWHRVERTSGRFWRQFRLPRNADVEGVSAKLEDGVLRITVKKVVEEKRKQAKAIEIVGEEKSSASADIQTTRAEM